MSKEHYIFGLHAVHSLLQKQPERVIRLCLHQQRQDKKIDSLLALAREHHVQVELMTKSQLDHLTNQANHQSVVAICRQGSAYAEEDLPDLLESLPETALILLLDSVQDPHNLGACFRSADAAGVSMIIAPRDKSASITPVVSKVACGAAEVVPFIQVTNLVRTMELLKEHGIWLYGAAGEADQTVYQADLTGPTAIVMGAEGDGLRRLTREHCDVLVKIPMYGTVSSLNVSVATGIILFEAARQRLLQMKRK